MNRNNGFTNWRSAIIGLIALLAVAGCGTQEDLLRAARPQATSTPAAAVDAAPALATIMMPNEMPNEGASAAPPLSGEELSTLSTEAQLALAVVPQRDLRELALRLNPARDEIPLVVNATTPEFTVGDTAEFWVHDLGANSNFQITAELIHKNDVAYAWVEQGENYNANAIADSIDHFAAVSYPAETALFGNEWKPGVDNDPRLHVLHATGIGAGVAGYYSSADQYSRLANDFSNEKEMFYINLDWLNRTRDYEYYETVLAHELQHMIHWYRDRNEETWLNEGLSEYAQEVAGYPPDTTFASTFAAAPDTQLNTWRESDQSNAEHYGSAFLFVTYLAQRFGADFMAALVAHPANGFTGLDATLAAAGLDLTANDVFADWIVANYADDPNALGLNGIFGYRDLEQAAPKLEATIEAYPTEFDTTVHNYAADYYLLTGAGDALINFRGATTTGLAGTAPYSGENAWWSNRSDDSNARLTRRFDFTEVAPGTPLELAATLWWDIESDYDYGYVVASRDGVKWDILPGQRTTEENPSGNSFGFAYTGSSDEDGDGQADWVTERFDLSAYAGEEVLLRFEYVTDDAVNRAGWFVDDLAIPAIGYATDFERGTDGWESEGWLLMDNKLNQGWLLQLMEFEDNILTSVGRFSVDADGRATIAVDDLGDGKTAALAVSALAPVTTEPAAYQLEVSD